MNKNGNIVSKSKYNFSNVLLEEEYLYYDYADYPDILTGYRKGSLSKSITYNGEYIGNPQTYGSNEINRLAYQWGRMLSTTGSLASTLGVDNPFRYKGYYYDFETGLYLLTTRYYNPEWGRFLNADSVNYLDSSSINGLNLYAYCGNNPIMYVDPNGNFPILLILGGILLGGLISGVSSAITAPEGKRLAAFAGGFVKGAITTVAVGFALSAGGVGGFAIAVAGGFAGGFFGSVTAQVIMSNDKIQLDTAAAHGGLNAMISVLMYLGLNQLGVDGASFLERLTSSIAPSMIGLSTASYFESFNGFPNITETLHPINEKRNRNYNNSYNTINYRLHLIY